MKQAAQTPKRRSPKRPPAPPTSPPTALLRLQKILSQAGISSRRTAEELIRERRVMVNGHTVTELGTKANPKTDRITVDGKPLRQAAPRVYYVLHKPTGVVTTLADPEGRRTVAEFLPPHSARVYPVGRLDYHSAGLLLLTNDGELALRLMHPRYGIRKTYKVKVRGVPTPETLAKLSRGVRLDDGRTAPASARLLRSVEGKSWLEVTVAEGRNREVRRMLEAVGHMVEKLTRIAIGPLKIGSLAPGELRPLSPPELATLRMAVRL